jgi:hypothetical protein
VVASRDERRICHHERVHRVKCLHDLDRREPTLDLLAERLGVRDEQGRRHATRGVQRVGDVDQDLAVEVRLTRRAQGLERGSSVRRVDHELAVLGGLSEAPSPTPVLLACQSAKVSCVMRFGSLDARSAAGSRVPIVTS